MPPHCPPAPFCAALRRFGAGLGVAAGLILLPSLVWAADDGHGHADKAAAKTAAAPTGPMPLETAEFAVPYRKGLPPGFGPLQINMGILVGQPSLLALDEVVAYQLRRSVERMGRLAEVPLAWDYLAEARFTLDRHHTDHRLADGAAYTFESDLVTDPGETLSFAIRLTPPADAGPIIFAVRADVAKTQVMAKDGILSPGKSEEIPFTFTPKGSADVPFLVSVATGSPDNPEQAEKVEVTIVDTSPGRGGPITPGRPVSAISRIVRPPMTVPPVILAADEMPKASGKKGKDKDKDKKDGKKEEKKGGH